MFPVLSFYEMQFKNTKIVFSVTRLDNIELVLFI